jgi:hypothetical protein
MKRLLIVLGFMSLACMSTTATIADSVGDGLPKRATVPTAGESVEVAPTATLTVYGVCADVLNVRVDHLTTANVVRALGRMDIVTVLEWMPDGWARIGEGEYINGDWLCGYGE